MVPGNVVMTPKKPLTYREFLDTVKVVRLLWGKDSAISYWTTNIHLWYNRSTDEDIS